jgi:uncharacterized glyoxalase superfamily protein PhnB
MTNSFKPEHYNSVSPYFIVNGAQKMVDMLIAVFGAKELRRYDGTQGTIMHVEVQVDDSVIMISDATEKYPANKFLMHVYVDNVDAVFNKAIDHGCKSIEKPLQKEGDPDRRGTFEDFGGNTWAIGTQMSQSS